MKSCPVAAALAVLAALSVAFVPSAHADRYFTVGFETNNLSATSNTDVHTTIQGTPTIVTSPVHSGTYSLQVNPSASTEGVRATLSTGRTSGTTFTRFYIRVASLPPSGTAQIFASYDAAAAATNHVLTVSSTGALVLTNTPTGGTITATTTIAVDTWYAIGIRHQISNTTGQLELQVDCSSEGTPLTGVDTLNVDAARWNLGVDGSATITLYYDDLVVNSEETNDSAIFQTWSACPANLYMLEPASDSSVTWTKTGANCSGTTNTDCVDDEPGLPDDLSGYNASAVANNEDRLNSTTFSGGPDSDDDIISITVKVRGGGSSATGTNTARLLLWDQTGAQTVGATVALCDVNGWRNPQDANGPGYASLEFDPGTRTASDINSFDWGYEPISVAQQCRITALWVMVEWVSVTPPSCAAGQSIVLLGVGCR